VALKSGSMCGVSQTAEGAGKEIPQPRIIHVGVPPDGFLYTTGVASCIIQERVLDGSLFRFQECRRS